MWGDEVRHGLAGTLVIKFSVYRVMMTHDDDDEAHIREKVTYELEKRKQWHYTYETMNEMK